MTDGNDTEPGDNTLDPDEAADIRDAAAELEVDHDDASSRTRLRWGAATDTGRVRSINQDNFLSLPDQDFFAVADGMGGPQGGEVASQLALETVQARYIDHTVDGLTEAVKAANDAVYSKGEAESSLRGMGTTLVAVALIESYGQDVLAVVNVGDSRAYRFADGEIEQLTDDHSLVADLMRAGRISPEEAESHPQRNIVTRALGPYEDIEPDIIEVNPRTGDRFLLCSDGLTNEVSLDQIAAVLRRLDDPSEAARELVRVANEGGGRDNITCLIVDVVDDGGRAQRASAALAAARSEMATSAPEADVAGFSTALDDDTLDAAFGRDDAADEESSPRRRRRDRSEPRPRRLTWRVALFIVIVLGLFGGAFGAVYYYGRNTYFVGLNGDQVAIYRGRPGGLLWLEPELVHTFDNLTLADLSAPYDTQVEKGKDEPSLAEARAYVTRIRRDAATTTTSPTTTTVAGGTSTTLAATTTTRP
jgi:protein phosphatase